MNKRIPLNLGTEESNSKDNTATHEGEATEETVLNQQSFIGYENKPSARGQTKSASDQMTE